MSQNIVRLFVNPVPNQPIEKSEYFALTGKTLPAIVQSALEDLSLLNPASEQFVKSAKVAEKMFVVSTDEKAAIKSLNDNIIVKVFKSVVKETTDKNGKTTKTTEQSDPIKTVRFMVSDILALARIALADTCEIEYHQPRGGTGTSTDRGEIFAL